MPQRPTSQSDPETIVHTLHCINCGYLLVGLPREGVCPECGLPIAASTERTLASMLGPRLCKRLLRVTGSLEAAVAAFTIGVCFSPVVQLVLLWWAVLAWRLSGVPSELGSAEGEQLGCRALRRSAIALCIATLAGAAAILIAHQLPRPLFPGTGTGSSTYPARLALVGGAAVVQAGVFGWCARATLDHLASLARHIPDPVIVRRVRGARSLTPAWAVGLAAYFLMVHSDLLRVEDVLPLGTLALITGAGWIVSVRVLAVLSLWRHVIGATL